MGLRRLKIAGPVLVRWLGDGEHPAYLVTEGLPDDARLLNCRLGWPDGAELLFGSEQWSDVPEGQEIPTITPLIQQIPTITPLIQDGPLS
jgi:hypothetical protein